MSEIKSPPATISRKRYAIISVSIVLVLIAVAFYLHYRYVRIPPVESWGPVKLGMSKVDVTLAYGRQPDCPSEENEDQSQMILIFNGLRPCSTSLTFRKQGDEFKLARICAYDPYPQSSIKNFQHDYYISDEESITQNLGEPSFVSVHNDGTAKIMNFARYNVAFIVRNEEVEGFCVSRGVEDDPIRFTREYGEL